MIKDRHVYNTGIVGNCSFIAHINKDTNIDWLCWPSFEDSFILGRLLDVKKGGEFSILPAEGTYESAQSYLENTNILQTVITSDEGSYQITDFAPRFEQFGRYYKPLMLIRKVEVISGRPRIKINCRLTYDYGKGEFEKQRGSNHVEFSNENEKIRLTTNVPVSHFFSDFPLPLNETKYLVLTYGSALEAPLVKTVEDFYHSTKRYWRNWIKKASIPHFYQKEVIRSALALKIHQYEDTGAIIASSTTSLPEHPGAGRNWDYRYCWLRDSYYVLNALEHVGHFEEMEKYASYITGITQSDIGRLQPLYGIMGNRELKETILDHLTGYQGNQPVRIGNQAYEHVQNDVYGQAIIALLPLFTDHRFTYKERAGVSYWLDYFLQRIEKTIDEKDAGIWEFRNFENHHCYSNLFQWAGSAAALKIAKQIGDQDIMTRAQKLMAQAAEYIESCYDEERMVYTSARGSDNLDASTLQLIMMHYLHPGSERARKHLEGLERELKTDEGLFYRYLHKDDFGKPKSTFLICAFWYVEALACVGRVDEAQRIFENLMKYGNHLMLFSEDIDEVDGSQWGNFPQAYSHVGLMNAAYRIAIKLDEPLFLK